MKRLALLLTILSVLLLASSLAHASERREKKLAAYLDAVTNSAITESGGSADFNIVSKAVTNAQEQHNDLFRKYYRQVQDDVKRKHRWNSLKSVVTRKTKPALIQYLHDQITLLVGLVNKTQKELEGEMKQ